MPHADVSAAQLNTLCELYGLATPAPDDRPYTDGFEKLYEEFRRRPGLDTEGRYVWKALCNARKAGRLIRKEK
jgi:hypothetical protein